MTTNSQTKANSTWDVLHTSLQNDTHPGAIFLAQHLEEMRTIVKENPTGKLLTIEATGEPGQIAAMAGVATASGFVQVYFFYVVPKERNKLSLLHLMEKVTVLGNETDYGFVAMRLPKIKGLEIAHSIFAEKAVDMVDQCMATGVELTAYVIPKAAWEKMFRRR